ncbi:hypothetical protein F442_03963 [Phytophthora nicotianae P10297]|uniref:Uncharacterized protein n=1 Tax=Phytophthora nicotianae P10297 TaxID=1317064 RepID=W2ZX52_PHYNI|nr:hypothetical protein F442_03963 [Phytophthora nicotianae P10297]
MDSNVPQRQEALGDQQPNGDEPAGAFNEGIPPLPRRIPPAAERMSPARGENPRDAGRDENNRDHNRVNTNAARYDRVIKSYKIEEFDGTTQPGALDSGISL